MKNCLWLAAVVAVLSVASAQAQVKVETVLEGLTNPTGVAIQPETGDVYVSDSGAHRVIRVNDGKAEDVITGFPNDIYGKGPMYDIGPLGLLFLDKDTLVVGGGGNPDGKEMLRVYKLPGDSKPIKADKMEASFTLAAENVGTDKEIKGEGNFYALAHVDGAIFVTSNGDDTKGWVAKAEVKDGKVVSFKRSIATKEATGVDAPVGATIQPKAGNLVIGQMGEITVPKDSLLTFYEPKSGKMLMNLETGLFDITGLAYSSQKGELYATDFAWMDTSEGGLFRLVGVKDGGKQTVKAEKVAPLDKPTALAFGPDGALYITVIGTGDKTPGKLLKIAPGL